MNRTIPNNFIIFALQTFIPGGGGGGGGGLAEAISYRIGRVFTFLQNGMALQI